MADGRDEVLAERIEALAGWLHELDGKVRASAVAGDAKQLSELAKALEAWSKHDPKLEERVTNRIDVLADRFTTLAGTVNTTAAALAGRDGEIAALRRELEDGQARIESLVRELRQSGAGTDVGELRKAVASLAKERGSRSDGRVDAVASEVDVLAQRLDTLSKTVSTTAAALAGREGELAALRSRLEDGSARVESVVGELRRSVDQLAAQVSDPRSSSARDPKLLQLLGQRLDGLGGKVDELDARLDAISASIDSAAESSSRNELELDTLRRSFIEAGVQVDAVVGELRDAISAFPEPGTIDAAVEGRLQALGAEVEALARSLEEHEAATTARVEAAAATAGEHLQRALEDVSFRLAGFEQERDTAAAELVRASEAWADERAALRARLESLASSVERSASSDDLEPRLHALSTRLQEMERARETVETELVRLSKSWTEGRAELRKQLAEIAKSSAADTSRGSSRKADKTEKLIAELAERITTVERDGSAAAAEIARAETSWAERLGSLEARIEARPEPVAVPVQDDLLQQRVHELAARLDAVERERAHGVDSTPAELHELEELRVLVNGLRMRQSSSEKVLAVLAESGDLASRLDDLGARLATLERGGGAWPAHAAPVPGDGRFRVELRGLELRMERLEAAARENRDAVLEQFERLASRLQWRIQQLEAEDAHYGQPSEPLGQVVPLRGDG